jgi:hypothetical protein
MLLKARFAANIVLIIADGHTIRVAKASAQALLHLVPALFAAGDSRLTALQGEHDQGNKYHAHKDQLLDEFGHNTSFSD